MTFWNKISVCTLKKNGGNYILPLMTIWRLICDFVGYTQHQIMIDIDPIPMRLSWKSDFITATEFFIYEYHIKILFTSIYIYIYISFFQWWKLRIDINSSNAYIKIYFLSVSSSFYFSWQHTRTIGCMK